MSHIIFSIMPMFVCLFWVIILLIDKQNSNLSKRFLSFFLSISIIYYFVHALYFNHQYELYTFFDSIWCFTSLAGYPLYNYYIRLLTKDTRIEWKWIWLIIPSLSLALFSAIIFILMSQAELDTFIHGVMYHKPEYETDYTPLVRLQMLRLTLFRVIFIPLVFLVLFFGLKLIIAYNAKIKDFYSNTGGKDLTPIKWLLIFFVLASAISLISSAVGKDYFVTHPWLLAIPSVTHSLYLFGLGYFGYKQRFSIEDFQKDLNQPAEEAEVETESEQIQLPKNFETQCAQLIELLKKDEIFTNPDLRITDLAAVLNTNRTYASRLCNEYFHTNFADLINRFRTEKAKELMLAGADGELTLDDIMVMSGFASESSYYRSFMKETWMSPGDFRKSVRN